MADTLHREVHVVNNIRIRAKLRHSSELAVLGRIVKPRPMTR